MTTTGDTGAGSLRQAILDANTNQGPDTIRFNLPGGGPFTISPGAGGLPGIVDPVTIDATTQPGYNGVPIIELTGAASGAGSHGFRILSGGSTVRGFAINRFTGYGISIEGGVSNLIQANFIGTGRNGNTNMGNVTGGILVYRSGDNLIGGLQASDRNVISGTNKHGILILDTASSNNVVQGNLIGTDPDGTLRRGNAQNGILLTDARNNLIGGTTPAARNIISGNGQSGVYLLGDCTGNVISGNYIGTDISGTTSLSNAVDGVTLYGASSNIVGGTMEGAGNVISGNHERGVFITSNGKHNQVQGNLIGTKVGGLSALGNRFTGVGIANASSNIIGPANIISGNKQSGIALGANAPRNKVSGNFIGVDITGTNAMTNLFYGVSIGNSSNNVVGGIEPGDKNIISGNLLAGIYIAGTNAPGNEIQGNFIGTSFTGKHAIANAGGGVRIEASGNIIGGNIPAARNIISGNAGNGVYIFDARATSNSVRGNFIGTDVDGIAPLPNAIAGVGIVNAAYNTIGGINPGDGNVISGNLGNGIYLSGVTAIENRLQGNYIGTDPVGLTAVPNKGGIYIYSAPNNLIGGISPGAGNLISGNKQVGISIGDPGANGTLVRGNYIGTMADGLGVLGNQWHGIEILNTSSNNIIGGTTSAAENRIAYAQTTLYAGVRIRDGCNGNQIRRNSIFGNALLGIDLGVNGVNANDTGDGDSGANGLQNIPNLNSVSGHYISTIQGVLNSKPNTTYTVEFFGSFNQDGTTFGEGERWIGQTVVSTGNDGKGNFAITITNRTGIRQYVAAIATDPLGNSSEFSKCVLATALTLDSDGDGMPDEYELANGFQPSLPADAYLDADGDGYGNLNEYRAGTDPLDALDNLRIQNFEPSIGDTTFEFSSREGRTYAAEVSTNLAIGSGWSRVPGTTNLSGNGKIIQIRDTGSGDPSRFYRIKVLTD